MKSDTIARRYAQALFTLGQEKGNTAPDLYGEALSSLADMVSASPQLLAAFKTPVITQNEKRAVVTSLLDKMGKSGADQTVRDFCLLLTEKDRLSLLGDIAVSFNKLLDASKGVVRGELTTAVPLSKVRQEESLATLEKQSKKKLVLRFEVDPNILGGIVLRIGDTVLDASLRAQLNSLRDTIKRGV